MYKVLLHGSAGKMGAEVIKKLKDNYCDTEIFCGVDAFLTGKEDFLCYPSFDKVEGVPDIIIDFSHHSLVASVVDYAVKVNRPIVLATTGLTDDEKKLVYDASKKIPVFWSANMSLGVAVLVDLAKKAAKSFPDADIEIVEAHHNRKVDSPSGTALLIADGIKEVRPNAKYVLGRRGEGKRQKDDIGISSLRMANIIGEHEVLITTDTQQIVLKHTAFTRALFADGAVYAASKMIGRANGIHDMFELVKEN